MIGLVLKRKDVDYLGKGISSKERFGIFNLASDIRNGSGFMTNSNNGLSLFFLCIDFMLCNHIPLCWVPTLIKFRYYPSDDCDDDGKECIEHELELLDSWKDDGLVPIQKEPVEWFSFK